MQNAWLSKDIAGVLKDHADPITYGRLLRTSRVFQPTNPYRLCLKLQQLLDSLPQSARGVDKAKTAYTFFRENVTPAVRAMSPNMTYAQVQEAVRAEWRAASIDLKLQYERMHMEDQLRYMKQSQPDECRRVKALKVLVRKALDDARNACSDDTSVMLKFASLQKSIRAKQRDCAFMLWRQGSLPFHTRWKMAATAHPTYPAGPTGYQCFTKEHYAPVKASLPEAERSRGNVCRTIAQRWKTLTEDERDVYEKRSKELKIECARNALKSEEEKNPVLPNPVLPNPVLPPSRAQKKARKK